MILMPGPDTILHKFTSKRGQIKRRRGRHINPFWGGHLRSIPQGMTFDDQLFVKSLFCPIKQSPNVFFESKASIFLSGFFGGDETKYTQ